MVELSVDTINRFTDAFKHQLKYHRKEILRCTQEEFATKLNISSQYYKTMEHGYAIPSTKMLIHLAEGLGFRVDYLFRYFQNGVKNENKSQEQLLLEQINNTCSDSERRALIYHWMMYLSPERKSGFKIVEDRTFSPEDDVPAKRRNIKSQPD